MNIETAVLLVPGIIAVATLIYSLVSNRRAASRADVGLTAAQVGNLQTEIERRDRQIEEIKNELSEEKRSVAWYREENLRLMRRLMHEDSIR